MKIVPKNAQGNQNVPDMVHVEILDVYVLLVTKVLIVARAAAQKIAVEMASATTWMEHALVTMVSLAQDAPLKMKRDAQIIAQMQIMVHVMKLLKGNLAVYVKPVGVVEIVASMYVVLKV